MQNISNHKVSISRKQLDQCFALAEQRLQRQFLSSTKPNPMSTAEFLARFGIRSPADIVAYMNSQDGKTEKAIFLKAAENLKELQTQSLNEALAEARLEKMMLLAMLGMFLRYRELKADKLNRLLAYDIDKRLAKIKEANKNNAASTLSDEEMLFQASVAAYQSQIAVYNQALLALNTLLVQKNQQIDALTATIASLTQQITAIQAQGRHIAAFTQQTHQVISALYQNHSGEELLDELEDLIELHENQQIELELESAALIEQVTTPEEQQEIVTCLQDGQHQINVLKEMHQCEKEKHHYFGHKGQRVDHYHEAGFALPQKEYDELFISKNLIIVHDPDTGKTHLLHAHEDLNELKNSADGMERLEKSHQLYKEVREPYRVYLTVLKEENELTLEKAEQVVSMFKADLEKACEERDLLESQKQHIEADRDECTHNLTTVLQQNPHMQNQQSFNPTSSTLSPLPMKPTPQNQRVTHEKNTSPNLKLVPPSPVAGSPVQGSSYHRILFTLSPELRQPENIKGLNDMIKDVRTPSADNLRLNLEKLKEIAKNEDVPEQLQEEIRNDLSDNIKNIKENSPWYKMMNPSPYDRK